MPKNNKLSLFCLIFIWVVVLISCQKEREIIPCLNNPLQNNETLKRMVDLENRHNADSCSILLYSQIENKIKEYYFVFTNGSPILKYHFLPNSQIISCSGVDIAEYYDEDSYKRFFETARFEKKIWSKPKLLDLKQTSTCNTLNPMQELTYFKKLDEQLNVYAWKSAIFQYKYNNQTIYYGIFTSKEFANKKYSKVAAMTCDGTNLQDLPSWNQGDFLAKAILERQVR